MITVKDPDTNMLLPLAGLWKDDEYGEQGAQEFADKQGLVVVKVTVEEINAYRKVIRR